MIVDFLLLVFAAAFTENIVLCRGFEYGIYTREQKSVGEVLRICGTAVLLTTLAGGCGWFGRFVTEHMVTLLSWTRPALYVAVYSVMIILILVLMNTSKAVRGRGEDRLSIRLVYGFVPLGTLFVVGNSTMGGLQSLIYGFGAGIGFVLIKLLGRTIEKRLEYSDVPQAFRGMPVTLLSLGLLSLAFYGLLGHPLAA